MKTEIKIKHGDVLKIDNKEVVAIVMSNGQYEFLDESLKKVNFKLIGNIFDDNKENITSNFKNVKKVYEKN